MYFILSETEQTREIKMYNTIIWLYTVSLMIIYNYY